MMFLLAAVAVLILINRRGKPMGWFGLAICLGILFSPLLFQMYDFMVETLAFVR